MGWFDADVPRETYGSDVTFDGRHYYAIIFPPELTRDRGDLYRKVLTGLGKNDLPVLFDFSQVERFDTSGLALLHALLIDQPGRAFHHRGMGANVQNVLEVYDFREYIRSRILPLGKPTSSLVLSPVEVKVA
jgi:anti-anti-sigma regulatory factor